MIDLYRGASCRLENTVLWHIRLKLDIGAPSLQFCHSEFKQMKTAIGLPEVLNHYDAKQPIYLT